MLEVAAPLCQSSAERHPSSRRRSGKHQHRAMYTVKFAEWVYVLHCFQKKSKSGIKTPKEDMELINIRLKAAKQDFETW